MLSWKCYNCERCGSDFASPTALKQHFRARHAGKEMCDRCGSEVEREKLQEHEQVRQADQLTKAWINQSPHQMDTLYTADIVE